MKNKKSSKRFYLMPLAFIVVTLLLISIIVVYALNTESRPHSIVSNQSTTTNIEGGKYKQYNNNHFKYSLQYPSDYRLVENLNDNKDGYYRQTVLSKDTVYDVPNTKFTSGAAISFWFYTDRTMAEEMENIKKANNNEVTFKDSEFKGLKSIELRFHKFPDIRRIFIPRSNGFLTIDLTIGNQSDDLSKKQYEEDFHIIVSSFAFLN